MEGFISWNTCGYVSIPKNHPFYGKNYWDIEDTIEVHGGLTFSGKLPGLDGLWFGWDYMHAGDYTYMPICIYYRQKVDNARSCRRVSTRN